MFIMKPKKLNLGCYKDYKKGYINLDFDINCKLDVVHDMNKPMPFKDNEFDEILCLEMLEHLYFPSQVLQELKRILNPNGILIASMPNETNLATRLRILFKGNINCNIMKDLPHHFHFTNVSQQIKFYEQFFSIKEVTYITLTGKLYNKLPWKIKEFLTLKYPNLFCECAVFTLIYPQFIRGKEKVIERNQSEFKSYNK